MVEAVAGTVDDELVGAMLLGVGPVYVVDSDGHRLLLNDGQRHRLARALSAHDVLTTQQAADRLGISRPTLVKLLDGGTIPSTRPGGHRRVLAADLEAFRDGERLRRRTVLDDLAAQPDAPDTDSGFVATR